MIIFGKLLIFTQLNHNKNVTKKNSSLDVIKSQKAGSNVWIYNVQL